MQSFTALSLNLALALISSTHASPSPRTTTVSCTPFSTEANVLFLSPPSGNSISPGFNSTYTLSDALAAAGSTASAGSNPPVLLNIGNFPYTGDNFVLETCASSYMGYPTSATGSDGVTRYYGHLVFINAPIWETPPPPSSPTCITLHTTSDGDQFLTNESCSTTDDASQATQFWELATVVNEFEDIVFNVTFLSAPQGTTGTPIWLAPGTSAAPAIVVQQKPTTFQLTLQYVHVN